MTLRIPAKVLLHVWSYDFYDMTLSTGKQRRHMINIYIIMLLIYEKAQVGNDQDNYCAIRKKFPLQKTEVGKTKLTISCRC